MRDIQEKWASNTGILLRSRFYCYVSSLRFTIPRYKINIKSITILLLIFCFISNVVFVAYGEQRTYLKGEYDKTVDIILFREVYIMTTHPFDWWTREDSQTKILEEVERQYKDKKDNKIYPQADTENEYYLIEFQDGSMKVIPFEETQKRSWYDICADLGKKTTEIKSSKIKLKEIK